LARCDECDKYFFIYENYLKNEDGEIEEDTVTCPYCSEEVSIYSPEEIEE
jgi:DNA-directed RNA polymerase subunit RPC12/RpoP